MPFYKNLEQTEIFYQRELSRLYKFLKPLRKIWSHEVLNFYPKSLEAYPQEWIENRGDLSFEQQWQIERGLIPKAIENSSLGKLLKELTFLEEIPKWTMSSEEGKENETYPPQAFFQVSPKKKHEITQLIHFLKDFFSPQEKLNIIDIGGGKGLLASFLYLFHGHDIISVDCNSHLQDLGRKRLKKMSPLINSLPSSQRGSLTFLQHFFENQLQKENSQKQNSQKQNSKEKLFERNNLSLGLHTCGDLALAHLNSHKEGRTLLNFGCCYQKLHIKSDTNLSYFTRNKMPLILTPHSLTLATRGHTKISQKDFKFKKRVKLYRGALHLWMLQESLGRKEGSFPSVGNAKPRDYAQDFGSYAQKKLAPRGFFEERKKLNDFFESSHLQREIKKIFSADLIRWRFGRVIEKYILMDRALSQIERGHHAQLYQVFDPQISPRNTALFISERACRNTWEESKAHRE